MADDRRAYDTGTSGQAQENLNSVIGRLEGLIEQRSGQVKQAMADFRADGVDEEYQGVEQRWNKAAGQVNKIITLIRGSLASNDQIAEQTMRRSRGIVTGI